MKKFETEDLMDSIDLNETKEDEELNQKNEESEEFSSPRMKEEEEEPCSWCFTQNKLVQIGLSFF